MATLGVNRRFVSYNDLLFSRQSRKVYEGLNTRAFNPGLAQSRWNKAVGFVPRTIAPSIERQKKPGVTAGLSFQCRL
jgi:hypothetical protein